MVLRGQKSKLTNLRFLYSQDLSNCTTPIGASNHSEQFLYSQDLSNCTTATQKDNKITQFLYSQDLSNCTTYSSELKDTI